MLPLFNQFILKQAVRNSLQLVNPPVLSQDEVNLPRNSNIHYLDTTSNNHFPDRELYYFSNIPANKKIPVYTITELVNTTGVGPVLNKQYMQEVRKWYLANIKQFRNVDLLEIPNNDNLTHAVFNYNILKDLYKYLNGLGVKYLQYSNLYSTYWNTIKQAIEKDKESIQFVSMNLPNLIPSYNLMNILLKYDTVKLTRVVKEDELYGILDLFRWLTNANRDRSVMSSITDEDSKRIVIEFRYKGYSSFLPLYILRALSKESTLDGNVKVADAKMEKIFILLLRRVQDTVTGILEPGLVETDAVDSEVTSNSIDEVNRNEFDDNNDDEETTAPVSGLVKNTDTGIDNFYKNKGGTDLDKELEVDDIESFISNSIAKFETDNQETDNIYEQSILKAKEEKTLPEEEKKLPLVVDYSENAVRDLLSNKSTDKVFDKFISDAVEFKTLTSTEIRSLRKLKENRANLPSPYSKTTKLDDYTDLSVVDKVLDEKTIKLDVDLPVIEEDLKKDVIKQFDSKYLKEGLKKDIVACVSNLENSGLLVKDYTVEEVNSSIDRYEVHKLTVKPLNGKESTVFFRLPKIDSEGEYVSAGIRYKMRKVRQPLPIVKVSPTKVALTSNYGKLFVFRTERKASDPFAYLVNYIRTSYINEEGSIKKVIPGVKTLNRYKLPNVYFTLASNFNEVRTDNLTLLLNYKEMSSYVDEKTLVDIQNKKLVFCGHLSNKHIVVTDYQDKFYDYTSDMTSLGSIEDLLGIDADKVPKAFSTLKVLGDNIPLGVCFGYYLGLSGLISVTGTKFKTLEANKQYRPEKNELVLRFNDYKLILTVDTTAKQLLFNGYLFYKDLIKRYNLSDFNDKFVYLNTVEFRDSGLIHLKELSLLQELFLDPITVDILREMKEPTEYLKLLLRANDMLEDLSHPDVNDPNYARIRGYDRVPGLMYRALSESVREHRIRGRNGSKVELDPYKVWNYVTQDSTVKITEDVNPVVDVKEAETVTLSGMDGLSKDATPKFLRRYHKNDMGLISEGTVDSSDVALNTYLTPYAKLKNTRGMIDTENTEHIDNKAKLYSTPVQLSPLSEYDDAKRVNFAQIQLGHMIGSSGYKQPILRTGYEYLMPFKVGKLYAVMAKDDGQVIDKTGKLITVKYKDNSQESVRIGTIYGRMEGTVYPHDLITDLEKGSRFKRNDPIAYNKNFFERDWLDPSKLVMKMAKNVTVALTMNDEVFEDSSAISSELSKEMMTTVIKEKIFIIDFNKNIVDLLPEGTKVEPTTTLFTTVDGDTDFNNLSESTINMLQGLASLSPKAKYDGVIDRYEVKYNGELSDMSPTFRKLVSRLDRELYDSTKGTEYEASNNRVSSEYRSEGKNLNIDTLELKVFIRVELGMSTGDKGSFGHQMKSVISSVYHEKITTESGAPVHAQFALRGMLNRIVLSPFIMGTTNRLVKHVSKQVADVYFGS